MRAYILLIVLIFFSFTLCAQDITFTAADNPNDDGGAIILEWIAPLSIHEMIISRCIDKENYIDEYREAAAEIRRRILAHYEDTKCVENGDV